MNRSEIGKLGAVASIAANKLRWQIIRETYEAVPKICRTCGIVLEYKKRHNDFCSHACSAKDSNRKRHRRLKPRICTVCAKEWIPEKSTRARHCLDCRIVQHKGLTLDDCHSNRARRKYLIRKYGHRCQSCKFDIWMGRSITLELEHSDGNSENHNQENLKLLCPNCHSQTPTYKGKNRGNGRHSRMIRYREGKSF